MNQALAPRHLQLRDILLRRWKTNGLKSGDRIESQNEIVQMCDFSLITVVKTLKDLEAEGVIRREVGKGSFLKKAPWTAPYFWIGFLYNRDVVGGGIFRNSFYTEIVMAFERQVVGDGHSFAMASIANRGTRLSDIDALDMAVLTAISSETDLDFIDKATSQIVLLDHVIEHPKLHCYRVDYGPAMRDLVAAQGKLPRRFVYLDTEIDSSERLPRLEWARAAMAGAHPDSGFSVLSVDQESGGKTALRRLLATLREKPADVIFGHASRDWLDAIRAALPAARVYPFTVHSDTPGLYLDPEAWMADVAPRLYANFEDRQAKAAIHTFPAVFRP